MDKISFEILQELPIKRVCMIWYDLHCIGFRVHFRQEKQKAERKLAAAKRKYSKARCMLGGRWEHLPSGIGINKSRCLVCLFLVIYIVFVVSDILWVLSYPTNTQI